ncbi:hypothetical protein [Xylophilus ampelinus]|uniref:hypothetical protein n=1 Tax=Xylophilus ampelinus TaxID=54067 RepID=UPI00216B4740|nr:hypothetical protein [Xylophilus ampelinus]MCS4510433.1 hypothetical protein [Xylophilus ampelinus]
MPDMLSSSSGLAPGGTSDALAQRFQDLMQLPALGDDAQADETIAPEIDSQAQALDTQVLSGLVGATGLNHPDPESDDE